MSTSNIVSMKGIGKRFGAVTVLRNVDFDVRPGEVHLLAGENGAGKSTLMKILAGAHPSYEGQIYLDGALIHPRTPAEARALGIAVIHQELSIIPTMTVADNLFVGDFLCSRGFVSDRRQRAEAQRLLSELGIDIDCNRLAGELPVSAQQLIEVAKALRSEARVVVMDEPTSALNANETERLFGIVDRLKQRGCGVIYITHKMEEIYRVADRITVLRDGALVGTAAASDLPLPDLIEWMVGRRLEEQLHREVPAGGNERLRVENFTVMSDRPGFPARVAGVSFSLRSGEILGIAGLQGSGNSDLFLGLFGALGRSASGTVMLDGDQVQVRSPQDAIRAGIALLTNDRKTTGLVLSMSVAANMTLAVLKQLSPGGLRKPARERAVAASLAKSLRLRAASLDTETGFLSGGNQQKVALGKWIETRPRVLLLDEPTRGVDVGSKREIYQLMNEWTASGVAILLISSELPELLGMSDRVMVMHRGAMTALFDKNEATAQRVLAAAMGQAAA